MSTIYSIPDQKNFELLIRALTRDHLIDRLGTPLLF